MEGCMKDFFPDFLDGARVLFYTPKGNYGDLYYDDGTIAAHFSYLAICKYDKQNGNGFYVFMCNENYEVETDQLFDTIDDCFGARAVGNRDDGDILWIEKLAK